MIEKPKKEKSKLINLRVRADELKSLKAKAEKHTRGNLSFWLKEAGLNYVPNLKK